MTDYEGKPITIGARIEFHPGVDLWMQGAKYGDVIKLGDPDLKHPVLVRVDRIARSVWTTPDRVRVIS